MSYNVNELDNRVEEYLKSGLQDAEEWRRAKAAMPTRDHKAPGSLLSLVTRVTRRTAGAVRQAAAGLQDWIVGFSKP